MLFGKPVPELSVAEAAARHIFDRSPDAYSVIEDGKIVECNAAMEAIMAATRDELLGVTPEQLSPQFQPGGTSSDDMGAAVDAEVAAKGVARFEWTHQRLDGTPLPVLVTLMQAEIAGKPVMISMWQDIRELVAAREAERLMQAEQAASAQALEAVVSEMGSALDSMAAGDLSFRLDHPFPTAYESLRINFNTAAQRLRRTLAQVIASAGLIASGLRDIAAATEELSTRTEGQAARVEETAAFLETISAGAVRATERTDRIHGVAASARRQAQANGDIVTRAIASMTEIRQSSQEVGKIVGVIDDIAFQTNLLALNAAVEAARAGSAGQGFAVVAAEVRRLAQRSTDAARSVKELIGNAGEQVSAGAKLVGETGEALDAIVGQVVEIAELAAEISETTRAQAGEVDAVSSAINQIDGVTQQNAGMVEQTADLSGQLVALADDLRRLVAQFRIDGDEAEARRTAAGSAPKLATDRGQRR